MNPLLKHSDPRHQYLLQADKMVLRAARTENEKNRRRDLITALRSRRQQMLLSLKRDTHPNQR